MYRVTIDKETIAQMPVVVPAGHIHLIDSISMVKSAVEALRHGDVIGFDTETKPSFKRGQRNHVSLLQLATDDDCFLFRLHKIGLPDPLVELLEDPDVCKVGISTHDDFHMLQRDYTVQPAGFVELQQMAKEFQIAEMSLQKIYAILFGEKISKSQRLTNWQAESLTEAQQQYAALDAWACIRIYRYLRSGAFDPTTSPYWHELTDLEAQNHGIRPESLPPKPEKKKVRKSPRDVAARAVHAAVAPSRTRSKRSKSIRPPAPVSKNGHSFS